MFDIFKKFGNTHPLSKLRLHQYIGGKICICGKQKNKMMWECFECLAIRPDNGLIEACDAHTEIVINMLEFYRKNNEKI